MLLLHHDDADREYAYDRKVHVGKLDKALDARGRRLDGGVDEKGFQSRVPAGAGERLALPVLRVFNSSWSHAASSPFKAGWSGRE